MRFQKVRTEITALLKLGLPVIGAQLAQILMSFTDTVMAGNLSVNDLAAVSVGSNLVFPLFLFSLGALQAVNPIIAHAFGGGRFDQIGPTVRQSLLFSQVLAAVIVAVNLNMEWVPSFIGIEAGLHEKANGYVRAFTTGVPAVMAMLALRFSNDGTGNTKPGLVVALAGLPLNVFLNWVFMYGKFGFPAMGAVGTGWATACIMWFQFFVMLAYCRLSGKMRGFRFFEGSWRINNKIQRELFKIGIPSGLSFGLEVSMFAIVSLLMGRLGTVAVASHQIAVNVSSITFMVPLGVATAISIRVGQAAGAGRFSDASYTGRVGVLLSAALMGVFSLLMILFPEFIGRIYTSDPVLIGFSASLLQLAAIFQVFDGLQVAGSGALRGLKDTRVPLLVNFFAYWLIGLNAGYWLGIHYNWGPRGLWIGLIAGLTVAGIMHNVRFLYLIQRQSISESPSV